MTQWLWYFWIYSFLGWVLETAFALVTRAEEKRRRCLLLLPLCPVYGLGMLAVLALPPMDWTGIAVFGGLAATAVEYGWHWACEAVLGVRFWDYSHLPGNLGGRVCLPFSLAWGVLAAVAVTAVQPAAAAFAAALPTKAAYVCLLVFSADAMCTVRFLRATGDLKALREAAPLLP